MQDYTEELHLIAKQKGGKCLSQSCIGSSAKFLFECSFGHRWEAKALNIRHGKWCPQCVGRKTTLDDYNNWAKDIDPAGKCLSKKAKGTTIHHTWQCGVCGNIWDAIPYNVKKGHWCPECGRKKVEAASRRSIEDVKKVVKSKGGELLSTKYQNNKSKITIQCGDCGFEWSTQAVNLFSGRWCPKCAGNVQITIEDAQNLARSRNGKCLSDSISNSKENLLWECELGHKWQSPYDNIRGTEKRSGRWCPYCSGNLRERICRGILEQLFNSKFPTVKNIKGLINTNGNLMELDGFSKKLKIAFEHHGEQHYNLSTHYITSKKKLEKRIRDDQLKRDWCKINAIELLEIPYNISIDQLSDFIKKECIRKNLLPKEILKKEIKINHLYSTSIDDAKNLAELKEIAKNNSGKLISKTYLGTEGHLEWQCSFGHKWHATPYSIKSLQTWCPFCAGNIKNEQAEEILLNKIKRFVEEYGLIPSQDLWRSKKCTPGVHVYKRRFGGFAKAVKMAGFTSHEFGKGKSIKYTEEYLIKSLNTLASRVGRTPYAKDLDSQPDLPSKGIYVKYFGSWNNAIKEFKSIYLVDLQNEKI